MYVLPPLFERVAGPVEQIGQVLKVNSAHVSLSKRAVKPGPLLEGKRSIPIDERLQHL